ncbi:target of Nesh-SH3 isoform 5 precursor [Mus musculus]|uniref:ABI family member 3 binding protein n=1 Tax=Mus musculus TaxID=10090 RepID=Q59IW6_MOUSE|nr:target of Nesh-SH3 isoform 5 precursor [Mus musculus]BAD91391.1 target of Nesh-SH3 variant 5 [Mus musculus]|eukprot:NP_001014423.1 target of Nesh-SH3 isoform 5 precursor [Mus musculus]
MLSSLGCLLLCGSIALALGNAQKLPKGKKPSLKVHINTTSDSILLKFLRPNANVKLEGFLLGYGSNVSPNQYFPLPTEGKFTEAVVDAEPKYLIVVRPAPPPSQKKSCSGKSRPRKPLQLVVGTLTPSSVFLSWGFLINPHHDWTLPSHCPSDRFYTIRYREKDKEKKWIFQLCPATETIVENLKPNTVYEFGVKDNIEGGIWSKIFNHKTIVGSKNKVNGKIQSTYDQVHSVPVPRKLIPLTIIKQVIQNVTHRASTKSPDKTPFGGTILVHLIIPGLNESTVKLPTSIMLEISDALKAQLAKNETLALPAESKTPEVEKLAGQPVTVTPESVSRSTKPTLSSALDTAETALVLSEKTSETARSVLIPEFELPLSTLAPKRFPEFPEAKTAFPLEKPRGSWASSEEPWVVPGAKTSEDSRVVQPQTATYDVISSSTTSDETEIEIHTATRDPILDSVPPKTSRTAEQPRATLAPIEALFESRNVEIFTSPEVRPTTAAPQQTTSIPSTPKRQSTPKPPRVKPAPEPETRPSAQTTKAPRKTKKPGHHRLRRPKTTRSPEVPKSKPALEPATVTPEILVPKIVPKPPQKPKATRRPEVPQVKPAPRQTTSMPPKLKTPHSRMPAKEPVPKEPLHTTSKPKMPPSPEVADTTSVPKDERLSLKPDPEVTHSETAPLETRGIPLIPVISPRPSQEELQTAMEETDQSTQELFTTKIPRTTELAKTTQAPHRLHTAPVRPRIPGRPHGRPALNKTTTRPDKTKPRGTSHKNGVGTGTKQAPKPPSPGRNASVDSHATRKPGSVSGTRRPPIPHRHSSTRPVSPERRPLPPNNVTGKPGRAGIVSSSRVTSPPLKATLHPIGTATARPGAEQKEPTAPASEEEFGTTTDFSSSPTKETDPLGKPRFIGPHVRYIPKPENKPCSITDSVRRFPTEEATEGNATSPPQNPPTNLTVVTVEGCPSFVILDWEKPLNDTVTEYEVISRENGSFSGKNKSIQITNQTFSTVENLKPDTSYEFQVKPKNPLGEGPASNTVAFSTESADPRVSEPISAGRDAIWTERPFNSDSYSECKGKQYVKRTWYKKFVGVQLCNSLRYKIYLSDSLTGKFYNIGDQRGHGEDHCQFVDSFLDGRTGQQLTSEQLPTKEGYFRAVRQEPVQFGEIGGHTQINYVQWYECGTTIPGKW